MSLYSSIFGKDFIVGKTAVAKNSAKPYFLFGFH
jgi:hypothetical protein